MSIDGINVHLSGKYDFNTYAKSFTIKRAVERELSIIGEAVNRILKEEKDFPLSNAPQIISFRNRVIHSYDAVDDNLVWKIIMKDLPILQKEVEKLLVK